MFFVWWIRYSRLSAECSPPRWRLTVSAAPGKFWSSVCRPSVNLCMIQHREPRSLSGAGLPATSDSTARRGSEPPISPLSLRTLASTSGITVPET